MTLRGRVTLPEVLSDHMLYQGSCDYRSGQSVFIDASQASDYVVTFSGIIALAKYLIGPMDPFDKTTLMAIHAPGDKLFNKARMYQRLSSASEAICVGVFRDINSAWAFLGIEPTDGEEILVGNRQI